MIKIAINGFGRIGRLAYRKILEESNMEVVAINDLTDSKMLAHLLKYDTAQGIFNKDISFDDDNIIVDGKKILDKVSFTVLKDDKICILAKNDMVKTTLFNILSGKEKEVNNNDKMNYNIVLNDNSHSNLKNKINKSKTNRP